MPISWKVNHRNNRAYQKIHHCATLNSITDNPDEATTKKVRFHLTKTQSRPIWRSLQNKKWTAEWPVSHSCPKWWTSEAENVETWNRASTNTIAQQPTYDSSAMDIERKCVAFHPSTLLLNSISSFCVTNVETFFSFSSCSLLFVLFVTHQVFIAIDVWKWTKNIFKTKTFHWTLLIKICYRNGWCGTLKGGSWGDAKCDNQS